MQSSRQELNQGSHNPDRGGNAMLKKQNLTILGLALIGLGNRGVIAAARFQEVGHG
jgi:hypothetical protein